MEKFRFILISFVFPVLVVLSLVSVISVFFNFKKNDFYVIRTIITVEKKGKFYYEKIGEIKSEYLESGVIDQNKVHTKCKRLSEETMECVTKSYDFDKKEWREIKE